MLKILDLFCGAGGLSLGLEMTNSFQTVCAVDNWKPALDTYKYNNPNTQVLEYDLSKTYNNNGATQFIDQISDSKNIDIIVGGPPCQGMSLAGKRLNNDPRNQLFKSFVKIVEILKPKFFLMENVPGLLSSGNIYDAIIDAFQNIDYAVLNHQNPIILKAEMYGVPQIRRRVFFLGVRSDISFDSTFWPPKPTHKEYKKIMKNNLELFPETELNDFITSKIAFYGLPIIHSGEGEEEAEYSSSIDFNVENDYLKYILSWKNSKRKLSPKIYNHISSNHT